jgi:CRP-like cAMP-binding protein
VANDVSVITEAGASFGELSLMYGKPRTATVRCTRDGRLWSLNRRAFRGVLVERMVHEDLIKVGTTSYLSGDGCVYTI